jgi:general secretion pathway protein D
VAAPLTETIAAGTQELLVLYHPDYPEQFQKVRKVLQESVDRPARQVYIEALVVEVSRGNFDRLGVQWAAQHGQSAIYLGTAGPLGPTGAAASYFRNDLNAAGNVVRVPPVAGWNIYARIEALVSEDKAQILSRPSLVTLDNRQATIRVGNDIPVAQSTGSNNNIGYSYKSIPTGIMLNVRPRVSEDGKEISMLIDATVSDTVRGADLRVVDPDTNAVVVTAPTISTRRVQTYARIRDNMPLIIGGLIGKTVVKGYDRVPLLGAIPVIGALFGHTQVETEMREVIIVLTPTVVGEDPRLAKAQFPKDDGLFDVTGTTLFKEKFRIGSEDVVDSAHFRNNERFLRYREAANQAVNRDTALANVAPFSQFAGTRVPADSIFVTGMMYRMLDRLNAGDAIPLKSLRVFEKDAAGLPMPASLTAALARHGGGSDPESFFARNPGKAFAITYRPARSTGSDFLSEAIPEVRVVDCATREAWRKLLWDLNQPDDRGARYTILLQDPGDLRRLQLAVATHNTVIANGGERAMSLDFWLAGRMLNVQEVTPSWERILDADMARDYFIGEHYYAYFMQEHLRALESLDRVLQSRK